METHKEKVVPNVKHFEIEGNSAPKTPLKPSVSPQTYSSSWESSHPWSNDGVRGRENGSDVLGHEYSDHHFQNSPMSFGDLLTMNGSASYLPSAFPLHYQGTCDANSPQSIHHANGKNSAFVPTTPDLRRRIDSNVASRYQSLVSQHDEISKEGNNPSSMFNLQNVHEEVVAITDSSPGKASIAVESHDHDQGGDQVKIAQKKVSRKRYQPKVASEKMGKKSTKPKTPKPNTDSKECAYAKRKYVRKNKEKVPSAPPLGSVTKPREPTLVAKTKAGATKGTVKSCKKSLNFELYSEPQPSKCNTTVIHYSHNVNLRQREDSIIETSRGAAAYDLYHNSYQGLQTYLSLPTKVHPNISKFEREVNPRRSQNLSPCKSSNEQEQTRGTKRGNYSRSDVNAGSAGVSHYHVLKPSQEISKNVTIGEFSHDFFPNTCKKKRTEKVIRAHVSSTPSAIAPSEYANQVVDTHNYPRIDPTKATGSNLALPWIKTNSSSINLRQEQKALVLYHDNNQEQNALVAYERNGPFDPNTKNSQRVKVDLDHETIRVWNLLLDNINNEGIDGSDENKAKWWKNERSVFHGRVHSFIAQMRIVQGDRHFTPWKGSILDSIIGVFLTQSVADHISSSAFMELAAHFPLKLEGSERTVLEEPTIVVNEEPYIVELAEDDATLSQHSVLSSRNSTNYPNLQTAASIENSFSERSASTQPKTAAGTQCNYYDSSNSFIGLLEMTDDPFLFKSYYQTQHDPLDYMNWVAKGSQEVQRVSPNDTLSDTKGIDMLEVKSGCPNTSSKAKNSSTIDQSNLTTTAAGTQCMYYDSSNSFTGLLKMADDPFLFKSYYQTQHDPLLDYVNWVAEGSQEVRRVGPNDTLPYTEGIDMLEVESGCPNTSSKAKSKKGKEQMNANAGKSKKGKEPMNANASKPKNGKKPMNANASKPKKGKAGKGENVAFDWDSLRRDALANGRMSQRTANTNDSIDYEVVRHADVSEIADTIQSRGMNHMLAERIKKLLDRLVQDHGSIDMEWLRDIPPDKAKEYLMSIEGLGLKSTECVRLLTLHQLAFPVDTHVSRIVVRLGWVPLQPLPESVQLHLLDEYPILDHVQKYLWPRLCKLDQKTLYELHYHLITFGKVFCTRKKPNCNACPLNGTCRHFASARASAKLALPRPEEKSSMTSNAANTASPYPEASSNILSLSLPLPPPWSNHHSQNNCGFLHGTSLQGFSCSTLDPSSSEAMSLLERQSEIRLCEPIVEIPESPEPEPDIEHTLCDIEDMCNEDPGEIPKIKLNMEQAFQNKQNYMPAESNSLVALTTKAISNLAPKLKNTSRLRTKHSVYVIPDAHPLLKGLDKRETDDPCSYLLVERGPGETTDSTKSPEKRCNSEDHSILCNEETCSYCNNKREADSKIVRGTLLIPCRTAMRGSFPLNGTYFQVNEVFADHESSHNPIAVPRTWLLNLSKRTVYFGTSTPSLFKGLTMEEIQHCFWEGYVCVRGFDRKTGAPRPLVDQLHFSASKVTKGKKGKKVYDDDE